MRLEIILSVMNLDKKELDKKNITSKCTVINQTNKSGHIKYKNFDIYSYKEKGASNSRNRGLENATEDILILCDDDVVYNKDYEKIILREFKNNKDADVIIFNMHSPNRKKRVIKKNKRLHIYNSLHYASSNIAFRRKSIGNIRFDPMFGPNGVFGHAGGDDTTFVVNCLKKKLKIYSNINFLGTMYHDKSTWFKEYDENYFYDKGALFTNISRVLRIPLFLQFLLRHRDFLKNVNFFKAFKLMIKGSNDYLEMIKK